MPINKQSIVYNSLSFWSCFRFQLLLIKSFIRLLSFYRNILSYFSYFWLVSWYLFTSIIVGVEYKDSRRCSDCALLVAFLEASLRTAVYDWTRAWNYNSSKIYYEDTYINEPLG